MARALSAPLSPNEEITLRRIAYGIVLRRSLREADVRRLESLGLVEAEGRGLRLTSLGNRRYQELNKSTKAEANEGDPLQEFLDVVSSSSGPTRNGD